MQELEFEILHFSHKKSSGIVYSWFDVNLIFRVYDDLFKKQCLKECGEWVEAELTTNLQAAEEYMNGISLEFGEITEKGTGPVIIGNKSDYDRDDVFIKGHQHQTPVLRYLEKFDAFQYREAIQVNAATKGIIAYIEELKGMNDWEARFTSSCQLMSSIRAMDVFWD